MHLLRRLRSLRKAQAGGAPQVIACAGDAFYIDRSFSKREYELIFGGVLMLFAFVPVRPCSYCRAAEAWPWMKWCAHSALASHIMQVPDRYCMSC